MLINKSIVTWRCKKTGRYKNFADTCDFTKNPTRPHPILGTLDIYIEAVRCKTLNQFQQQEDPPTMTPLKKGKFWPYVRPLIWEKAQELFQEDEERTMGNDFTGNTATRAELREGGYFHEAKLIILDELWRQKKGLPTSEEEATQHGHF